MIFMFDSVLLSIRRRKGIQLKGVLLAVLVLIFSGAYSSAEKISGTGEEQTPVEIVKVRVSQDGDDAEEADDGQVNLNSSDIELINDEIDQTVGLRFQNVIVPRGAVITRAYIQFQTDEVSSGESSLMIRGQRAGDTRGFTVNANDISSRPVTTASVVWNPPAWTEAGEAGLKQRTSDLTPVIQEIINREDWQSGNSMVIIITGSGTRTAISYSGVAEKAALLHIEFTPPALIAPSTDSYAAEKEHALTETIEVRVSQDGDDAEEADDGQVNLNSSDLELINDGVDQTVGLRFQNVMIPRGAVITSAYIQFQADEVSSGQSSLTIRGQSDGDPIAFAANANDISSRPLTTASTKWNPPSWAAVGEAGPDQRTPDVSSVIREIVSRDDWQSGNSIVIIITGTGTRTAVSYSGRAEAAALLRIECTSPELIAPSTDLSVIDIYKTVWGAIQADNPNIEVGVYYFGFNYAKDDDDAVDFREDDDFGYGTAYADIKYLTDPWHGFRLGAAAIGAVKLYEQNSGDWKDAYEQNALLYEAYLQYSISRSYARAGRQIMRSIRFGYDAATGISLSVGEVDRAVFLLESFWEGTVDAGFDEISKWRDVKEIEGTRGEAASDAVFSLQTGISIPGDWLYLTPYYYIQEDFLSAYGVNTELDYRIGQTEFGVSIDLLKVNEDSPEVDYDANWHAFSVEPWISFAGFTAGAGYHRMSSLPDDKFPALAIWLNTLNPLEDGKRVLQSKANSYYLGLSYEWKWLEVDVQFSKVDAPSGEDAKELFGSVIVDISPNISSDLYFYLYNDDVPEEDYHALELLIRYNF